MSLGFPFFPGLQPSYAFPLVAGRGDVLRVNIGNPDPFFFFFFVLGGGGLIEVTPVFDLFCCLEVASVFICKKNEGNY